MEDALHELRSEAGEADLPEEFQPLGKMPTRDRMLHPSPGESCRMSQNLPPEDWEPSTTGERIIWAILALFAIGVTTFALHVFFH